MDGWLLGLIPIYLGFALQLLEKVRRREEEEMVKLEQSKANQLFWTVTLLTIASVG